MRGLVACGIRQGIVDVKAAAREGAAVVFSNRVCCLQCLLLFPRLKPRILTLSNRPFRLVIHACWMVLPKLGMWRRSGHVRSSRNTFKKGVMGNKRFHPRFKTSFQEGSKVQPKVSKSKTQKKKAKLFERTCLSFSAGAE